jgi:hypothetical protein
MSKKVRGSDVCEGNCSFADGDTLKISMILVIFLEIG